MEITVLHLTGCTKSGKTALLQKLSGDYLEAIQILTPERAGHVFDTSAADWVSHSAIAIDEVSSWDRGSVAKGIASLEAFAEKSGKKLILVSQDPQDLARSGVVLRTAPLLIRLGDQKGGLSISFDGAVS